MSADDLDTQLADAVTQMAVARQRADELTAAVETHSTDLVPAAGASVAATKTRMAQLRAELIKAQADITAAADNMKALMDAQLRELNAASAPLRELVTRLEVGIASVNLYLGRDEELVQLRDGTPCPVGTPITVRQLVLSMDQECAVAADSGGIDFRDIATFDNWLTANPAHLDQVCPEPKAVVALMARVTERDYGDPWVNAAARKANTQTYFLIRNGERLYRTTTDFSVGARLIPARNEFTAMFTTRRHLAAGGWEQIPLQPGTTQWAAAERSADARQRHYMMVALILQGLIDRTEVFHPLPSGRAVSFLHADSYDNGDVELICDAEAAVGTGRQPFRSWQQELNSRLRVGMRIIGNFNGEQWRWSNDHERNHYKHSRLHPQTADAPASNTPHTLVGTTTDGGLKFSYERSDMRYGYEHGDHGQWGEWPYQKRATCTIYPDDPFILPYDLVDTDTANTYLAARTERSEYTYMFGVLHAVIAAKAAEHEQQAPFVTLLRSVCADNVGVDIDDVTTETIEELVNWWKLTNRHHRPLVDGTIETAALAAIVKEHAHLHNAATGDSNLAAELAGGHTDTIFVGLRRNGTYTVLCAANNRNVHVHEHTYTAGGTHRSTKQFQLTGSRFANITNLIASDRWNTWDHAASASEHLTDPELADGAHHVADIVRNHRRHHDAGVVTVNYDHDNNVFHVWYLDGCYHYDTNHPLTAKTVAPDLRRVNVTWRRDRHRNVTYTVDTSGRYDHTTTPWAADTRKGDIETLHVNTDAVAELERERAHFAAHTARRDTARRGVQAWLTQLENANRAAQETAAYERFIDDFADPSLWDAHNKMVAYTRFDHNTTRVLQQLGEHATEHDIDLTGRSARDIHNDLADLSVNVDISSLDNGVDDLTPENRSATTSQ